MKHKGEKGKDTIKVPHLKALLSCDVQISLNLWCNWNFPSLEKASGPKTELRRSTTLTGAISSVSPATYCLHYIQ